MRRRSWIVSSSTLLASSSTSTRLIAGIITVGPHEQGDTMSVYIDINCDMGESYGRWTLGNDEEVMPHITSANVACGFHGGDPHVMRKTVELALQYGVAVGAHPGLPDLMGFGRRRMDVTPAELKDYHRYQTGALGAFVKAAGV